MTLHLKLSDFTPEGHFHAALVVLQSRRNEPKTSHDHDFWELMYVVKGSGRQRVNGRVTPLQIGTLLLIRPTDCHTFEVQTGMALHFINIAFSAALWREFCRVTGLEEMLKRWSAAPLPPETTLPTSQQDPCLETFRTALHAYLAPGPVRLLDPSHP